MGFINLHRLLYCSIGVLMCVSDYENVLFVADYIDILFDVIMFPFLMERDVALW